MRPGRAVLLKDDVGLLGGVDQRPEELVDLGVLQRLGVEVVAPRCLMVLAPSEPRREAGGGVSHGRDQREVDVLEHLLKDCASA